MHVLLNSFTNMRSKYLPKTPWWKFHFTTFMAMLTVVLTLIMDLVALSYYKRSFAEFAICNGEQVCNTRIVELGELGHGRMKSEEEIEFNFS